MHRLPKISVNIPYKPQSNLKPVLSSLKNVDYPQELIEIIAVEGNHIAKQRNHAIRHSSGEIVYLLDDDSEVKPDSFKILAREFRKKNIAAVGGPSLTKEDGNYLNFLIGCALETYFGAMRMHFRYGVQTQEKEGNEYRLIGANLALRKKVVMKIGMFNEKVVPNEETELLRRLKKAGYSLIYKKELSIQRSHRKTVADLAKQFHHYGIGRMKQILYNGGVEDFIFIIPVLFILYLISLFIVRYFWYQTPLLLYLILSVITSLKAAIKYRKMGLLFTLPLIFPIIHISYAFGLVGEIASHFLSTQNLKKLPEKLRIKILKLH